MELNGTNSPRACSEELENKPKHQKALFSFEGTKKKVSLKRISGGNGIEEPPVPIPNTEVKLNCVDGTWRATSRESRTLPDFFF